MVKRLAGIKKQFEEIAFIGPNPELFLLNMPKSYEVKKFTFIEQTEVSVQKSYDTITANIESGFYDKNAVNLPDAIEPKVLDYEKWDYPAEEFDLILNNMQLHWINELEATLRA